ncbi:MAG TPA: hypothetical protein VLC47_07280 [Burkholderiales bacterium]|nr:hypothetical protein [Burkholderiales bacterium]
MRVLSMSELERLVRGAFPAKPAFSAGSDLGLTPGRLPALTFVHGGPDPYLDQEVDGWVRGARAFVGLYPLLNRLCSAGLLPPGDYAVTRAQPQ